MRSYSYWVMDDETKDVRRFKNYKEAEEFARPILKWIAYNIQPGTNSRSWDWHFNVYHHLGFSFTYEEHAMLFKLGWSDCTESVQSIHERYRQHGW